jgi:aubergine-like protein
MRTIRGQTVVLVPELCSLTGLTDKMKDDFNLMKSITEKTQLNPSQLMNKCQKLLENIRYNKKCQEECKQWGIGIDPNPLKFTGHTLNAGNILLGQGKIVNLKTKPSFDTDIQGPMYTQPRLRKWALFVGSKDKNLADQFLKELQIACSRCQ